MMPFKAKLCKSTNMANVVSVLLFAHKFCYQQTCCMIHNNLMPAIASSHATDFPGEAHADFVVGDRDGSTASAALSGRVCAHLRALGYDVAYNHPYKGVELVRRYGDPAAGRHSIQLEINRKLYMNETTLALTPGFDRLKLHLRSLVDLLLETDPRRL